jgi:superfamily II DNA or RNA helicase
MRTLRDYQQEAVNAVYSEWAAGTNRTAVVLPTGCGKTDILAAPAVAAARAGQRVLILAHRGELLDQITERCKMHDPTIPVGRAQGGRTHGLNRPIVAGMVDTLRSEQRQRQMRKPKLIIVDECHHAASPSYMNVLTWGGAFDGVPTLGMTATMTRGDKRGLGDVWQSVAYERSWSWAIRSGWLVEPHGRCVVTDHMDLDHAKVSRGDFQDGELGEMVAQDVDQIVRAWLEHASGRLTVAFTPSVDSGKALAEAFRAAGIATGEVYGHTQTDERAQTYKALSVGDIRVLVSVMVTTEGWDCPPVSCVLVARPTKLAGLYQQMVGRGLRTSPETGKRDCLVLDVVGASRTQRLMTLIDLHESAAYDSSELPPCEECRLPRADCVCPKEERERDPDGGRRKLLGPAKYEDVDLFAASTLNWLFTRKGVRFVPAKDRLVAIWAHPDGTYSVGHCSTRDYVKGRYVGHDGQWLAGRASAEARPLTLDEAFVVAEAWAIGYDPSTSRRTGGWRKGGQPSPEQVRFAQNLGIVGAEGMNKARISDEISIVLASRRLDQYAA